MKKIRGQKILCLGCGPNLYDDIQFFGNIPKEIVGIDINKNNINFLKKSTHPNILKSKRVLENKKIKVKLIVGDILKLKREFINQFDTVYAIGVVGMFRENKLKKLLNLIYLYLNPSGLFLDVDWTECQLSDEKYKERQNFEWYSKDGPTIKKIGKLIVQTNFKIAKHLVYNVPNKKEYLWGKIYGFLAKK